MAQNYRRLSKGDLSGGARPFILLMSILAVISIVSASGSAATPASPAREYIFIDFTRFVHPLFLVTDFEFMPNGQLVVTEKEGRIRLVEANGSIKPELFLDLTGQVSFKGEEGLASIALHPAFDQNGYFYINYTDLDEVSQIVRYKVSATNPELADPSSAHTILSVPQQSPIHNGGELVFGPDGYLYIGFGDGGRQDDPNNNGQDGLTLQGAILRVDVDAGDPYAIPPANPFIGDATVLDEIWAMGLRNPWRFSFDRLNGDLYIGDVGGDRYEEINFERAPFSGGANYGWRCYEGHAEAITGGCQDRDSYDFPIWVLTHPEIDPTPPEICAMVGGIVHRGDLQSPIYGQYLFGDYCSGSVWGIAEDGPGEWRALSSGKSPLGYLISFGQDLDGELLSADFGNIYRISARKLTVTPQLYIPLSINGSAQ